VGQSPQVGQDSRRSRNGITCNSEEGKSSVGHGFGVSSRYVHHRVTLARVISLSFSWPISHVSSLYLHSAQPVSHPPPAPLLITFLPNTHVRAVPLCLMNRTHSALYFNGLQSVHIYKKKKNLYVLYILREQIKPVTTKLFFMVQCLKH
jgi:hypothetical protein